MRFLFILLLFLPGCPKVKPNIGEAKYHVGEERLTIVDKSRDRKLKTFVWYPVSGDITMVPQRGGPFEPVASAIDHPLIAGEKFPLVLVSHGSGGNAQKLFWFTKELVRRGNIVLAVNHPGNMIRDNSAKGVIEVWERPKDLSYALDHYLKNGNHRRNIDQTNVYAAGHSAGGTTVMMLAGGRFSKERFQTPIPKCNSAIDPFFKILCDQMEQLNLSTYSKNVVEADYSDARVKKVIAFDPGFSKSFDPESLNKSADKMFVYVAENLVHPSDEIDSKLFMDLLPSSQATVLKDSIHMSFLQPCRENIELDDELKLLCARNEHKKALQRQVALDSLSFIKQ